MASVPVTCRDLSTDPPILLSTQRPRTLVSIQFMETFRTHVTAQSKCSHFHRRNEDLRAHNAGTIREVIAHHLVGNRHRRLRQKLHNATVMTKMRRTLWGFVRVRSADRMCVCECRVVSCICARCVCACVCVCVWGCVAAKTRRTLRTYLIGSVFDLCTAGICSYTILSQDATWQRCSRYLNFACDRGGGKLLPSYRTATADTSRQKRVLFPSKRSRRLLKRAWNHRGMLVIVNTLACKFCVTFVIRSINK